MVNRRVYLLTFINVVVFASLFKWSYPEAEVTGLPFTITAIAFGSALIIDRLLHKYLSSKDDGNSANPE